MTKSVYIGGTLTTVPDDHGSVARGVPDVVSKRSAAKADLINWIEGLSAQITGKYPKAVRDLWEDEERMAKAYLATIRTTTAAEEAKLSRDGAAKGRTTQEQAEQILLNADAFRLLGEEIRAMFLATDHALDQETDHAQLSVILDNAKTAFTPIATAAGIAV